MTNAVLNEQKTERVSQLLFNSGHYQAIDLSEWLAGNPEALLKSNFSVSDDLVQKLPSRKLFVVP